MSKCLSVLALVLLVLVGAMGLRNVTVANAATFSASNVSAPAIWSIGPGTPPVAIGPGTPPAIGPGTPPVAIGPGTPPAIGPGTPPVAIGPGTPPRLSLGRL